MSSRRGFRAVETNGPFGPLEGVGVPRPLADDVGQVGRNPACQRQQLVSITADDLGNLSYLVFGRRRELVPLYGGLPSIREECLLIVIGPDEAPNLRRLGIDIEFVRGTGRKRERRIIISTSADRVGDRPSAPSAPSEAEEKRSFGADGTRTQNGPADGAAEPTVRKDPRKTATTDDADGADAKIPTVSGDAELAPDRTMGRLSL
jgi:hypothetical protein